MIKRYNEYINEEIKIGKLEHDFHRHKFKPGDICIFKYDERYGSRSHHENLDGKLCKILFKSKKMGDSFFQGISDFFHKDYCPRVKFARSKTNTYAVEFLDSYDSMTHLIYDENGHLKKNEIGRTDTLTNRYHVPEYMLKLDPVATKKYKEEQEIEKRKFQEMDPYGEEEWDEKKKMKNFKYDHEKNEWTEL